MSLGTGTTKAVAATGGCGQFIHNVEIEDWRRDNDQLSDPFSRPAYEFPDSQVPHRYLNLSAVIAINNPWPVREVEALGDGEAAAGTDEAYEAGGNFHCDSGGDQGLVTLFTIPPYEVVCVAEGGNAGEGISE